jgi:peptide-methionine (S)-S-oxide reductase
MMSHSSLVLGGGCFWCLDAAFRLLPGVTAVTSGYAGGHQDNPTYEEVCAESTGHAEVVKIDYDPARISREQLIEYFWQIHDPTQVGGQGHDHGTQYRSVMYFADAAEQRAEEAAKAAAQTRYQRPITTEVLPLPRFWPAEEYHQDYFNRNPTRGYCAAVIRPKVQHLQRLIAAGP